MHSVDITHHESARVYTCAESTTSLASLLYIPAKVYPLGPSPYLHISLRFGNVRTLVPLLPPPPPSSPSPSFFPACTCRLRCRHTCRETLLLIFSLDLLPTLSWRIALALSPSDLLSHIQKSYLLSSINNIKLSKTTYLEAPDKIRVSVHNRHISSSFVQVRRENSSTNSCLRRDSSAQQDIHSTFFHRLLNPRLCAISAQRRVHWASFASANSTITVNFLLPWKTLKSTVRILTRKGLQSTQAGEFDFAPVPNDQTAAINAPLSSVARPAYCPASKSRCSRCEAPPASPPSNPPTTHPRPEPSYCTIVTSGRHRRVRPGHQTG